MTRLATAPRALILDYGGVVVSTAKRPTGFADLAEAVAVTLRRAGIEPSTAALERTVRAGVAALKDFNNMSSRRREPVELTHREIVTDFLVSDLSDRERLVCAADAARLCQAKVRLLSEHQVRPGLRELLRAARARGIRTGIASNAQSGAAHRSFIDAHGLTDLFDVQVYSDELGLRKPHPGVLHTVADTLGVPVEACWYVGDTRDRDLLAGRRAGVGAVVLIRHHNTDSPKYAVDGEPDAIFDEVTGLVEALAAAADPVDTPAAGGDARAEPVVEGDLRVVAPRPAGALPRPRALLLDNGGVLSLSEKSPDGVRDFALRLGRYLRRMGHDIGGDARVFDDLEAGRKRYQQWKENADLGDTVPEITAAEFWRAMVAPHWPDGARAALLAQAPEWMYEYVKARAVRRPRPGMVDVLVFAQENGIAVGVVSNTICGRVPRENQIAWGFEPYLGASFFSDEFGFRKPDPSIARACAVALGVEPGDCWFVGDKRGRDVLAARRADAGAAVLVESRQTAASAGPEPDLVVPDAAGLLRALRAAV